jgi:hypothetical protein
MIGLLMSRQPGADRTSARARVPLAVGLADDGAVAALRLADPAGGEHQVDRAERVLTPFEWCSMPRAWNRKLVFAVPHHSAACRSERSGTPVDVGGPRRASTRGNTPPPDRTRPLCARMNARSIQSCSIIIWQHAGEQGRVAPGFTGRYRSQVRATGVIRGSWTMIFAPCSRACHM